MRAPQDRKGPGGVPRGGFDATGQARGERINEYFDFERWPEKAAMKVTRIELIAILTRADEIRKASSWRHRVWLFLKRPWGSKPATLAVTKGEIARGEVEA